MAVSERVVLGLVVVCALIAIVAAVPVGDRLERTFLLFESQPLTASAAESAGWMRNSDSCDHRFGYAYAYGNAPSASYPEWLFYTAGGQLAGFGLRVWSEPAPGLVPKFWVPTTDSDGNSAWDINVSLRNSSIMCSGAVDHNNGPLGDQISINQFFPIPLTAPVARAAGWVSGNCIPYMGIHHAFDLNKPGSQTWNVSSLVPLLPMYNVQTLRVSAVLIWEPHLARYEPAGPFEGPFTQSLFCKNWCSNAGCQFTSTSWFSTLHWMFTDPSLNACTGAPCIIDY
eukprot:TRINITY_DN2054_c0_g1_i1.p1 TRINITY_DN2054_c0_g1~~TRINITY_DN2054_c0_g1_i1.p1  ORF type:complete len:284 (+),score=33.82 TRINITY_DN2054_c0_g1_i1:47-898(+)